MAVQPSDTTQRTPIKRGGQIRRCWVRMVSIVPAPGGRAVEATCLLGGREHPLSLGPLEEARSICNACVATTIWRVDED